MLLKECLQKNGRKNRKYKQIGIYYINLKKMFKNRNLSEVNCSPKILKL